MRPHLAVGHKRAVTHAREGYRRFQCRRWELAEWPAYTSPDYQRMRLDLTCHAEPEPERERYLALDAVSAN